MSQSSDKASGSNPAQASVEPASVEVASATATSTAVPTAATAATPDSQVAKCNDPAHAKINQINKKLMDLYYLSSGNDREAQRAFDSPDLPDKHDIHNFMFQIRKTHRRIAEICRLAKEANPELEMREDHTYTDEEEYEEDEEEDDDWYYEREA